VDKQQKLKIILPALAVVMFLVWKPVLMGSGPKGGGNRDTEADKRQAASGGSISNPDIALLLSTGQRSRARTAHTEWDRNPFVLGQKQDILMVEGIFWDENNPSVMISGNILGVGGKVGAVTVIDIKPNSVVLRDGKGEVELGPGETR
jgi:hypothetical protein